ncbi:MAG TPA: hypothetical protein DDW52_03970 [Planctomycetaceae bacterium]|nr:hypothetical protein [Planctomycetaceae bacterium]
MNTKHRQNLIRPNSAHNHGFTVIELLIVMGIIVIVAAVTLPTLKGLLSGRKIAEASNLVSSFAASAKSRAISTGRPVALIIERARYDDAGGLALNNVATRLSIGEVFPAYSGDWEGATGTLQDLVAIDAWEAGRFDAIDIPLAQAATLVDLNSNPPISNNMVQPGDLIEIGGSREKFFIAAPNSSTPAVEVVPNGASSIVRIHFNNPSETTSGTPLQEGALTAADAGPNLQRTFRIYRRPSKSLAGGISLPRGTCIDLHFSGCGQTGRHFSSDAIQPIGDSNPYPHAGFSNYGPIYLVFSPDGQVSSWFVQNRPFDYASPTLQRGYPTGLIHLLVGGVDQVVETTRAIPNLDQDSAIQTALTVSEEYTSNLMDTENNWVTINPYTGSITTSSMGGVQTPIPTAPGVADLVNRLRESRALASSSLTLPNQGE